MSATHLSHGQLSAVILDYGLRLVSLTFKLPSGKAQALVLGGWSIANYEQDQAYHGAVIGRTCNRIAGGELRLTDAIFSLDKNEGGNHLHGGYNGLHNRVWQVEVDSMGLCAHTTLADGESGYPGNIKLEVNIFIVEDRLCYEYSAVSDRDTVLDLTNHAYFCLDDTHSILQHELQIPADRFVPVNDQMLPTGVLQPVANTPFDLNSSTTIGERLESNHEQLSLARGFDHSWLLTGGDQHQVGRLVSPISGVEMLVTSTSPAVQVYTGNHLPNPHSGICLETQHLPDACHHAEFTDPVLKAKARYTAWSHYGFRYCGTQD